MAAKGREKIKLVSSAGTGYYYTTTKNKNSGKPNAKEKLQLKKFDPKAPNPTTGKKGAHVIFKEDKIK